MKLTAMLQSLQTKKEQQLVCLVACAVITMTDSGRTPVMGVFTFAKNPTVLRRRREGRK
jgi:hypothetical protein